MDDDFYELSNHDEVERRFAGMVAMLPSEGALWRSGVLDAEVVDLLQSSSQGDPRLDLLPPTAIPAAVLNACLDASWWEHGDRARLFKAAVRHALRLAPALTLRFTSRAMDGDLATIAPGADAHTVLLLADTDKPQWLLAGVTFADGTQHVLANRTGPWIDAAWAALARLRAQVDR